MSAPKFSLMYVTSHEGDITDWRDFWRRALLVGIIWASGVLADSDHVERAIIVLIKVQVVGPQRMMIDDVQPEERRRMSGTHTSTLGTTPWCKWSQASSS
jgi:hypothetical protein